MERKIADTDSVEVSTAAVTAPDLGLDPLECVAPGRADPCTIVIMGATGDLTSRKLIPALFDLYRNGGMPDRFSIVGCGRSDIDSQEFRARMQSAVIKRIVKFLERSQ